MFLIKHLKRGYKDVLNILYPRLCLSCSNVLHNTEHNICHNCLANLHLTDFDIKSNNPVYNRLSAIVNIEKATALFVFDKSGIVQELIHQLKYNNHQEIGKFFAETALDYLTENNFFNDIDYIVPVPLHPKKQQQRGYNQMTEFGRNLGNFFSIPYTENILLRQIYTESQTKKNALQRRENVSQAFKIANPEKYAGKHFVIIDDVITTGATIEACAETILNNIPNAKVSVLALTMVL